MMTESRTNAPLVAIACGGTGGHFFPGLAVAEQLVQRSSRVLLLVSPKELDQQAVQSVPQIEALTLPAVGWQRGERISFLRGFLRSCHQASREFRQRRAAAVLAMGGFTSAAPLVAAIRCGALAFLHESNAVPGRTNRWLSWLVERAFVGFPSAGQHLPKSRVMVTGTPVRCAFGPKPTPPARIALGLDPARPVLLVMGGSQGAHAINDLLMRSLPTLKERAPALQYFHLTGAADQAVVGAAYAKLNLRALVHPFFGGMELALASATLAVCRAGASSLAELAAMQVPSVLIPYPAAADNHQFHNARAWAQTGAARLLEQPGLAPETLARTLLELLESEDERQIIQRALLNWQTPRAASLIADEILSSLAARESKARGQLSGSAQSGLGERHSAIA